MTYRFIKVWVLLLCCMIAGAAFAQNSNSSIRGTVEDASGAVVPGATVTLTNVGTGQELTTTAKSDGFYTFTNLSPANYKVSVANQGFAQWVGVLTLRVSQSAEVDPKLVAASVTTQVTVHDVTPVIDRVNPTISDVKNATAIETLPVQNRNILSVLAFSPGVVAGGYGGSGGGYTRVNGIPGGSVDYLIDGQTASNRFTNELQSNPQPTPTFQEVKIITTNGDAQYSRPGIVELVTKSGTNHFHGQVYELNQNNHLQATYGQFQPGTIPYLQHNEFGAQLGGPVWAPKIYNGRNKTFFFFDYEGIRQNANKPEQYTVPPPAMKGANGDANLTGLLDTNNAQINIYDPTSTVFNGVSYVRTQFPNNTIPANRLNPVSHEILNAPYGVPDPNINLSSPIDGGQPNYEPAADKSTITNNLYTAKVDQLFGANRLALRYTYTNSNSVVPKGGYILNSNTVQSGGHNGSIEYTQVIGSHAINVIRAGIQYAKQYSGPQPITPPITTQINAGLPAGYNLPTYINTIAWPGFYWYSYYYNANKTDTYWTPIDRDNPKNYPDQTVSAGDQFSLNRGNHQMMFGFDASNYRVNYYETGQPGGNYQFGGLFTALQDPVAAAAGNYDVNVVDTGSGLADFLLGDGSLIFLHVYPPLHTRQTELAGYAQDNWRVTPRLTFNLGLRYTFYTAFEDSSKVQSTLDPTAQNGPNDFGEVVFAGSGPLPGQTSQGQYDSFVNAGLPIESAAAAHYPSTLWNMPKNNWEPRVGFAYQLSPASVLRGGWRIYQWAIPLVDFQQLTRSNAPFSYSALLQPGQINGTNTDPFAAELEFPIAAAQYGGPQPLSQYQLGSSTFVINPDNILQGSGFTMAPMNPNYKLQSVQEYSLTLSQELPGHFGFDLSYIGNHSYNLIQGDPINYEIPRLSCPSEGLPADCQDAQRRAYPRFQESGANGMEYYNYNGYSNTNELQARLQHTFGNGLLLQTSYTWQRTLTTTEGSAVSNIGGSAPIIPAALTPGYSLSAPLTSGASYSARQRAVYAPDSTLPNKTFQLNAHYEFPFGQGKRFMGNSHGIVNALVSGYNVSPFFLWHSGFPFGPGFSYFGSSVELAPGKSPALPENQRSINQWYNGSLYNPANTNGPGGSTLPYAGQTFIQVLGLNSDYRNNIPRNYLTGPGFNRLDATVYKLTPIYKNLVLDFEAQFLNIYNHVNLALPNTNLPNDNIVSSIAIQTSSNPQPSDVPRTIQLQAKVIF